MKGLNGTQGVVIPIQNVEELMLREDVIDSVRKGEFHIYPITRVEEGIAILTGVKAGERTLKGYEKGTVFYYVEEKIKDLYAKSKMRKAFTSKSSEKKKKK